MKVLLLLSAFLICTSSVAQNQGANSDTEILISGAVFCAALQADLNEFAQIPEEGVVSDAQWHVIVVQEYCKARFIKFADGLNATDEVE